MNLKDKCVDLIVKHLEFKREDVVNLLETPPKDDMGDLAMPCFRLAQIERKAPQEIARDIAQRLDGKVDFLEKVVAQGPYVNFYYDKGSFAVSVFAQAKATPHQLISYHTEAESEDVILVEFSSPNIAKPFHVGHGFSTCLGASLANIYEYLGYKVKRLNHLGDYGTQFGRLIYAWLTWGNESALEEDAIKELTRVYVKFHVEAETNDELFDKAREHFRKLEKKEELEYGLWARFRELSLTEFSRIYDRLKISFDNYNGESFYSDMLPGVVDTLRERGILEESKGAQVVNLDEYKLTPCIILKSDGSSIYATRDIAAIFYRFNEYAFAKNIYVVGREQKYHFEQVFSVIDKLNHESKGKNIHVAFGYLRHGDQNFSTREGKVILLEDFLDETVEQVKKVMAEGSFDMEQEEAATVAEAIAIATVKFLYLKSGRENDISFTWEEILDFNGDTAPYLLYAYARARSVLRKASRAGVSETDIMQAKVSLLSDPNEISVLKDLSLLHNAVVEAAVDYEPSVLVRQIIKTVRNFNRFYQENPILKHADDELKIARLALCNLFTNQIKIALALLGIEAVERM